MICGADNWVEIEEFAKAKEEWFRRFLKLPNGIPFHDTFGQVFGLLDPEQFSACFMNWCLRCLKRYVAREIGHQPSLTSIGAPGVNALKMICRPDPRWPRQC